MAFVITQTCCKDGSCVPVCPVDCIRPAPRPGEFAGTEMLYIDPATCIDCGACMEECPVDAIYQEDELPSHLERYRDINSAYFEHHPLVADFVAARVDHAPVARGTLRVAVVGTGPAACYAAAELIRVGGVEVDVFERLPTPFGLVRAGVAPDHQRTKAIVEMFTDTFNNSRLACHFNVEIGRDVAHNDLMAHHHAVIYAVGGSRSRCLNIAGEMLPGSHAAADFVAWYNGHPDHADQMFDLSGERAVIIGNGNVALDVARVLLMSTAELARTDIAGHAFQALSQSSIREIVVLGRRGPRHSAFSAAEFLALTDLPDVEVVIDSDDLDPNPDDDVETALKLQIAREVVGRPPVAGSRRIVFRYQISPQEFVGEARVSAVLVASNGADGVSTSGRIETGLVLRSIGYTGSIVDGVPHDAASGTVLNRDGRVVTEEGHRVSGVYVTGWVKRGPRGVIGTNRTCAEQTVAALWEDFDAGILRRDVQDRAMLDALLRTRGVQSIDWAGWRSVDAVERKRGADESRPRAKLVNIAEMLSVAKSEALQ